MEAQWTPFLPAFCELRRLVGSGALGGPLHLYSDFGQSLDEASHPRLFEGAGAGVLLDFGVYPIVLALQLLGPVGTVRAALRHNARGVDVQAALQLVHVGGGQSQLAASMQSALPNSTVLSGRLGRVRLDSPVMGAEWLQTVHTAPALAAPRAAGAPGAQQRLVAALRRQAWLRRVKAARADGRRSAHSFGAKPLPAAAEAFHRAARRRCARERRDAGRDLARGAARHRCRPPGQPVSMKCRP